MEREWHEQATRRLMRAAVDHVSMRGQSLTDALVTFADELSLHDGPGAFLRNLARSLFYAVEVAFPDPNGGATLTACDADGAPIDDPDAAVAGDVEEMADLAAVRFVVAAINGDYQTAVAVLMAVEHSDDATLFALFVRGVVIQIGYGLTDPHPGRAVRIDIDQRDKAGDDAHLSHPYGPAAYGITVYPVAHPEITRDDVVAHAHAHLARTATDSDVPGPLCGVEHAEDLELGAVPHTGREAFRDILAERRAEGGEWQLLRVWQHYGTCPQP